MAFKLFSRSAPESSAELGSNSEFSSFSHSQYGNTTVAEPAVEPETDAATAEAAGGVRGLLQRMRSGAVGESAANVKLPLIGHLPSQRQLSLLTTTLGVSIMLSVLFVAWNAYNSGVASTRTQIASDVLMHSQRIGKAAPNAIKGNKDATAQLEDSRSELNRALLVLADGGRYAGRSIISAPGSVLPVLNEARKKWSASDKAAATIAKYKWDLAGLDEVLQKLNAMSPDLLSLTEEVTAARLKQGGSAKELAALGKLGMLTQRMSRSASNFLTEGGVSSSETAFQLGRDATVFRQTVDGFLSGGAGLPAVTDGETRENLLALKKGFEDYDKQIKFILDRLEKFSAAKAGERLLFAENEQVRASFAALQGKLRDEQDSLGVAFWLMVAGLLMTLISAAAIGRVLLLDSQNRGRASERRRQEAEAMRQKAQQQEEEAKAMNEQNQAAILRLMNELQEVADGDLTVQATVSEDITGAIADSVNYTVEELRGLVGRVTVTAEQVTAASTHAQGISTDLLNASQAQSKEIQEASNTVVKMANEITDVSRSAAESADVARQSVAAARQGSTAVQNAIKGMDEIREQIQETSKRIKRLGESSQEIGEITELISDITEQTNVLALNAAIQAASAGEAGRGFSVVAEEVQRLAERSAEAAKQIGALVKTIQTDTHDAVAAMEKSTQGVVEGAKLSDAAGTALNDISQVSDRLAELIQGISYATGMQATSANGVAHNMQHILQVTQQTQDGTQQTASSVRKLTVLAQELKNSVSRFRISA
ncbi:methyl-accepting chemotaxis protein [Pseudoduganella sp. OTU4001]|uniref:methyl-accepting chemotaxis protein n=1 Tax=Pseudoduganella sp. OTU4001 TaxID=3043854 RepID=UPI00313B3B46